MGNRKFKRNKIAIVGGGNTGATTAIMLAQKELGDIVLLDIPQQENTVKGKALDMLQASPVQGFDVDIIGTSTYEDIRGVDLVIITAGVARKPGMSRDDLVRTNASIMEIVATNVARYAPDSYILVLSNPVDVMTYVCYKKSSFPKNRVIGQSGVLDTARFNTFVAQELGVSIEDVNGFVLGGHGDDMVPLVRYSFAGGIPLEQLISRERLKNIVKRTRKGGGEIVNLLGNGSAYYAPAASIVKMVESVLKDKKRILPSVAYLEGEYGFNNLYLGVPTILGCGGIEKIIELDLTHDEQTSFNRSAQSVWNAMEVLN